VLQTSTGDLPLSTLDVDTRQRLMTMSTEGPEPLWLWLNEAGLPLRPQAWSNIFTDASARYERECRRLGRERDALHLSPHSLRFSYALFVLVVLHQTLDRRYNWSPLDPYDERRYSPAYDIVRDLLGHRSTETTRNIYLRPVKGLRGRAVLSASDVHEALALLSQADPRVRDLTAPGSGSDLEDSP
jgi:integrase